MQIRLLDLSVLLLAAIKAAKADEWHDINSKIEDVRGSLNKEIWVKKETLESLIAAVYSLNDAKIKWHPDSISAEQMVRKVTPKGFKYDKTFRIFKKIGEK